MPQTAINIKLKKSSDRLANIIIIGPAYPLRGGGMSTFNERLAREFIAQGHQTTIYTFSLQYPSILFPGKTQYADEPPPQDLTIHVRINSINPLNWICVGNDIKKEKPDLVVFRYWMPFMAPCLGTIAARIKRNRHTRLIAITDNVIPHEKRIGDNVLTKFFLNKMHGFVTMSNAVASELESFGISTKAYGICPHPLYDNYGVTMSQSDARKKLSIDKECNIVLFFGFIRDYKGLDLLIKAIGSNHLVDTPLKLLIAGEFYTKSEPYTNLIKALRVEDKVILHNSFIPNNKVNEYFCAADIVAQPYKSASQSGVTQIAYHFEVPMLVTNVGGLPEMVKDQVAGYVVNPDAEFIALALKDFFVNKRKNFFKKQISQEKKKFSWQKMTQTILEQATIDG